MSCDIIIPVHNQLDYTMGCLESIKKNTEYSHRIIVVDDASGQETKSYLENAGKAGDIVLLRNENNLGWLDSVNKGISSTGAEYVCVMNNDTVVYPAWLSEMVAVARKDPAFGIVNPEWEIPGRFKGSREEYFQTVIKKQASKFIETDWARGFCFLVKRAVIEKIGGLDKAFSPGYFDDWDYSLRAIQAGFLIVRAQGAFVRHYKNVTYEQLFGKKGMDLEFIRKKEIFYNRWGKINKVILVVDKFLKERTSDLEKTSLCLLRQQARLVVMKGDSEFTLNHTNCLMISIPEKFIKFAVLCHLLRNSRLNRRKRYDYLICSDKLKLFLERFRFISARYPIKTMASLAYLPLR